MTLSEVMDYFDGLPLEDYPEVINTIAEAVYQSPRKSEILAIFEELGLDATPWCRKNHPPGPSTS